MSEQNILNPAIGDPMNPDYGADVEALPDMFGSFQATDGSIGLRRVMTRGRVIDLTWNNRLQSTIDKIRQWASQYDKGFFTYADYDRSRYYTGRFAGPVQYSKAGNNKQNAKAQFVELPNLPMYQYPTNWARDAVMRDNVDDFGKQQWKLTGAWAFNNDPITNANAIGGTDWSDPLLNDYAEMLYYGYGFRLWQRTQNNVGIAGVYLDGTFLANVDGYAAVNTPAAALFTKADVPLGLHRVKLVCTATKNAASSNYYILADAIQVMR